MGVYLWCTSEMMMRFDELRLKEDNKSHNIQSNGLKCRLTPNNQCSIWTNELN